ncbi:unnamed protein product [Cylicocyclus nassatus]|uniref:Uncharacterized protein n=1 Tax=Cylicocyclus nassatus TaxID=53992 RepID=A0AA36DJQ3_CYLNA|nr:unnamed protein product [Cylicocyclus nassatus]
MYAVAPSYTKAALLNFLIINFLSSISVTIISMVFCYRTRVKIRPYSPLRYNPDDPSTFMPEKNMKKAKKSRKSKKSDKSRLSNKSALGSKKDSGGDEAGDHMRAADDLETVGMVQSAWGEVQPSVVMSVNQPA